MNPAWLLLRAGGGVGLLLGGVLGLALLSRLGVGEVLQAIPPHLHATATGGRAKALPVGDLAKRLAADARLFHGDSIEQGAEISKPLWATFPLTLISPYCIL